MLDDSQDEPSDTWLSAAGIVLAALVLGSFIAWIVSLVRGSC